MSLMVRELEGFNWRKNRELQVKEEERVINRFPVIRICALLERLKLRQWVEPVQEREEERMNVVLPAAWYVPHS